MAAFFVARVGQLPKTRFAVSAEAKSTFLTAEWRHLAMLNYEIDPAILTPFVPAGTELDSWSGKTFVSLVGFQFINTRVRGIPIPFHRNFEEVNLRFYVRHKADDGWRRGVVFIKEIVPRAAIAFIARKFYNEPYIALPMAHRIDSVSVEFSWRFNGRSNSLKVIIRGGPRESRAGSEAEFITEHYWGYTARRNGSTLEYRVEHPRWRVWDVQEAAMDCDVADLYGNQFVAGLSGKPSSVFLAEGSAVSVSKGTRLDA
jgi:uncharacterized protein YqjF (DUF2071 family)